MILVFRPAVLLVTQMALVRLLLPPDLAVLPLATGAPELLAYKTILTVILTIQAAAAVVVVAAFPTEAAAQPILRATTLPLA